MKNTILILVIALIVSGCKSDTNQTKDQNQPESVKEMKEEKKEFIVDLSFKTNNSYSIQMVLYNISIDEYQSKYIVINEKVEPTSTTDKITANFQENISNNFRINFGNQEVKEIELPSIEVSYGSNKLSILASELSTYFDFNEFIEQDPTTFKLRTKKVEGKHNPTIYLKQQYIRELQEEQKEIN